jgi:hypothetical protein
MGAGDENMLEEDEDEDEDFDPEARSAGEHSSELCHCGTAVAVVAWLGLAAWCLQQPTSMGLLQESVPLCSWTMLQLTYTCTQRTGSYRLPAVVLVY